MWQKMQYIIFKDKKHSCCDVKYVLLLYCMYIVTVVYDYKLLDIKVFFVSVA